jgi:NitT/TauT family transport system substrate-binding protein
MTMNRSQFVASAGAVAALGAFRPAAAAGTTIRLSTGAVEEFAQPYYAVQKGFFKDAGLTVELSILPGGGLVTQAVIGGALDAGVTNSGSMSSAHVRGLPIYWLFPGGVYSSASPIAHLVVAKNSPINNAAGLAGKVIGVTTLNDMVQATGMLWIDKHGGDSHASKWFEIKAAEMAAAIQVGRIDAAIVVEPTFSGAKDGFKVLGLPYEAVNNGKPFQTAGLIGNKTWVDANPDLTRKLVAVIAHTADWANHNPVEEVALLAQLTGVDPAAINSYPRVPYATKFDPGLVQPVIDVMVRYGFLPKAFSATDMRAPGA